MARKRMVSPEIWQSEDFSKISPFARLIFIGLFSNADDEGRGRAKAAYVKSMVFPYDECIKVADVDKALDEIGSNMSVTFYTHDGNEYYCLDHWANWQKVDKPQRSNIPAFDDHSTIIRRSVGDQSANVRRQVPPNRIEENRRENIYPPITPLGGETRDGKQGENLAVLKTAAADTQHSMTLVDQRFADFWKAYPKKQGKGAAEKSFKRICPTKEVYEQIINAIAKAKQSEQWTRENGRYIPNPSTWLNQRRWEDEYPTDKGKRAQGKGAAARTFPQRESQPDDIFEVL